MYGGWCAGSFFWREYKKADAYAGRQIGSYVVAIVTECQIAHPSFDLQNDTNVLANARGECVATYQAATNVKQQKFKSPASTPRGHAAVANPLDACCDDYGQLQSVTNCASMTCGESTRKLLLGSALKASLLGLGYASFAYASGCTSIVAAAVLLARRIAPTKYKLQLKADTATVMHC
jgi:hypothetical protein